MDNDTRSRKWQITINNPADKQYDHDYIKFMLNQFKGIIYWCMCDEIGIENQTYHTHVYVAFSSGVRFSTLKSKFNGAHFEMAQGTSQQNREYISKTGKWEKDKKKETNLTATFEEFGEMPLERQGARNDLTDLYDMIKDGMTNYEIIEREPKYLMNIDKLERARQLIKEEMYKNKFRDLHVTYISGSTGTGKTRTVMEQYGYENVYRITDYEHPFDGYQGQDVVIFEEFRSSLRCDQMLNYLDGYPLTLPCRYSNKVACYTQVFIITNIPFEDQYKNVQEAHLATWFAFKRRVHEIVRFGEPKPVETLSLEEVYALPY